ncbi:hypothetical protein [Candidatus Liberibacter solanacearum]|uniref:Uncharacterized protein n=1 Tax=Candidatus Liberibacter solanacearum TaxID=556287 RepID=A0A1V2N7V7_9HYPH|nr:hypothetical protein [Candidatus Liberibacter solanacearum]ONI59298.1 hypothetical protein AYJ09_02840 [Candidatus Liberibacter solanacearum]ONI59658.1 hypothetical protein AYO25_03410 [Candidatus Liberibacter solanacearum]
MLNVNVFDILTIVVLCIILTLNFHYFWSLIRNPINSYKRIRKAFSEIYKSQRNISPNSSTSLKKDLEIKPTGEKKRLKIQQKKIKKYPINLAMRKEEL